MDVLLSFLEGETPWDLYSLRIKAIIAGAAICVDQTSITKNGAAVGRVQFVASKGFERASKTLFMPL